MTILVSDTSVLIDLERGELIASAFKLSATFAVPDVLYERELRDYGGEELVKLGLKVESLDGDGVQLAMRHRQAQRHLTVPDSFALALAKRNGWTLLTGDGPLRELAKAEGVNCHGVLWLFDEFETQAAATHVQLHKGLEEFPLIRVAGYPDERLQFVLLTVLRKAHSGRPLGWILQTCASGRSTSKHGTPPTLTSPARRVLSANRRGRQGHPAMKSDWLFRAF